MKKSASKSNPKPGPKNLVIDMETLGVHDEKLMMYDQNGVPTPGVLTKAMLLSAVDSLKKVSFTSPFLSAPYGPEPKTEAANEAADALVSHYADYVSFSDMIDVTSESPEYTEYPSLPGVNEKSGCRCSVVSLGPANHRGVWHERSCPMRCSCHRRQNKRDRDRLPGSARKLAKKWPTRKERDETTKIVTHFAICPYHKNHAPDYPNLTHLSDRPDPFFPATSLPPQWTIVHPYVVADLLADESVAGKNGWTVVGK